MSGPALSAEDHADTLARLDSAAREARWDEARELALRLRASSPDCVEATFALALSAYADNDLAGAVVLAEEAVEGATPAREFPELLAVLYVLAGDLNKGLFNAKLATAFASDPRLAAWLPVSLPTFGEALSQAEELPLLSKALWGIWHDDPVGAEHWFRQHIQFEPNSAPGYTGLGHCLAEQGRFQEAIENLRAARHVLPGETGIVSQLASLLATTGRHDESRACHRWARAKAPNDLATHAASLSDGLLDPERNPADLAADARAWGAAFGQKPEPWAIPPQAMDRPRLTVAYLVAGLGSRAIAPALADMLAAHDRARYRVIGFGFGTLSESNNIVFQKAFDSWHNVRGTDPITFGAMVAAEGADILVDLSGPRTPDLLATFGTRMAPVQVSWLASPAGTGLAAMDALLTDRFIDPADADPALVEGLVHLEHGLVPLSLPRTGDAVPPLVPEDDGIVFVADAPLVEITPRTVELWAHALDAVPNARLVLRDYAFDLNGKVERLIALFGDFGMSHRIDVQAAPTAGSLFASGHVCLVSAAPTQTNMVLEALWKGRPVITLAGEGRHRRDTASLLHHLGLSADMVAESPAGYAVLAARWAGDADRRRTFANQIRDRLATAPTLDPARRIADLEAAFQRLWRQALERTGG